MAMVDRGRGKRGGDLKARDLVTVDLTGAEGAELLHLQAWLEARRGGLMPDGCRATRSALIRVAITRLWRDVQAGAWPGEG